MTEEIPVSIPINLYSFSNESRGRGPSSIATYIETLFPGRSSFMSYTSDRTFGIVAQKIKEKLESGEPVYVVFKDKRRTGSVGKILQATIASTEARSYFTSSVETRWAITNIKIGFDDSKNVCQPTDHDIRWLPNYTGPAKYVFKQTIKPKKPIPTIKDHLGVVVEVGSFISFVSRKYGNIRVHFGKVTRINENGSVWAKCIKLRDKDKSTEEKVFDADTILVMNKDLMDRIMVARLATQ